MATLDLVDRSSRLTQTFEICELVRLAAFLEEQELRVLALRRSLQLTAGMAELERYEVVAGEVADQIRRTDDNRVSVYLHDPA